MSAGEQHDELLRDELMKPQPMALDALGDRQEGEVQLVVAEHVGHLPAGLLAHGEPDVRMALMKPGERQRQVDGPHRVHRPDRQVAGIGAAHQRQFAVGGVQLGQDPPRADHQELPRLGERHPPGRALHECQPELVLEPADLLGERRLGNVLERGRAGEVPLLRERNEVAELAQFHKARL
jgi:hypothetical protein